MAQHLANGAGEARGLAWLMVACLLLFIAQLPQLSRQAFLAPDGPPFDALAGGAFLGTVLMAPLLFYGLAALSHLASRAFGGQGNWLDARLALFWGLLAATPVVLFRGLVAAFVGPGLSLTLVSVAAFAAFLFIWLNCLIFVERDRV